MSTINYHVCALTPFRATAGGKSRIERNHVHAPSFTQASADPSVHGVRNTQHLKQKKTLPPGWEASFQ